MDATPEVTTEETPEGPPPCPMCKGAKAVTVAGTALLVPCSCVPDLARWREARIPKKYLDVPRVGMASAEIPKSRWICGPPGVGKTRFACQILKRYARVRYGGLFVDLVELEVRRRDAVKANDGPLPGGEEMCAPFVVADDFARNRRLTDFWSEYLESFVRARYSGELPTVFTSNFTLEEIATNQGTWLAGRIAEMCEGRIHNLGGTDRRWDPEDRRPAA